MISNSAKLDLHDYASPINRADGTVPFNGYLWPTEDWWPSDENQFRNRVSGSWMFGIIALDDGRFSVDGVVHHIIKNNDNPYARNGERSGKPVVFATREAAIRISAARMIKDIRNWRFVDKHAFHNSDKMDRETMEEVINWTRQIVAKECGSVKSPVPITMPPPPPTPPAPTGLELIDYINMKDFQAGKHRAKARKEKR